MARASNPGARELTLFEVGPAPKPRAALYAEVALSLPVPHRSYEIPATALISDAQGTRVALVDEQNKIALRNITIETDTGATLHVSAGLDGTERVVKVSGANLREGTEVALVADQAAR